MGKGGAFRRTAIRVPYLGVTKKAPSSRSLSGFPAFPCGTPRCGKSSPGRDAGETILPKRSSPNPGGKSSPPRSANRTGPNSGCVLPTGRNSSCFRNREDSRTISTWERPRIPSPLRARSAGGHRPGSPAAWATRNPGRGHRPEPSFPGKASRPPAIQKLTGRTTSAGPRWSAGIGWVGC